MIQLWKDVFVALDVETTGLNPQIHEISQLSAVVATSTLQVDSRYPSFNMYIQPTNLAVIESKALAKSHLTLDFLQAHGVDSSAALRYWHDWLRAATEKSGGRVIPIGFNYVFDRDFLISFMGYDAYNTTFGAHVRDVMRVFTYVYDRISFSEHNPGFTSFGLAKCCEALGVENIRAHDSLHDSIATLECYRRLMAIKFP
jgi:exonuclease I